MNKVVKYLIAFVCLLLVVIGILCYNLGEYEFHAYLLFLVPMALVRLAHALLLIKINRKL